ANQRVQFGEAIGRFQLIQEKFAHMAIKLNSMKNMLLEAAWKANRVITPWFVLVVADRVVATVRQQRTGHGTSTHHAARCGISTN
ncbi:acyl-CoA dehydrogenase family protein, partial [Salmonella enterica subsp. enterica serovar Anatum]|nr:acyl-CoA dehydrogenase family protein [Salmonella enterica subsp. enterica serovar Anatum]